MNTSPFGEIMETLANNCDEVEAAVFFDTQGETVDYFSYLDPYTTRLAAAHHGILFESLRHRMQWLDMGTVEMVEICARDFESITVSIGDEYFLTILLRTGGNTPDLHDKIIPIVAMLCDEI
jgi:predicted regulator of Ras-like GTPase activity (Roadblock/LC7/MglB family)